MKLIILLFFAIGAGQAALAQSANERPESAIRSARAESTNAVRAISVDEMKKLVERREGRPLLINFWATWCEPCRAEFPDLVQIDDDYRARGLDLIIFSLDDMAELKTGVPQFLADMKATKIPAYLMDVSDPGDAVSAVDPEWNGALPATFLFDRNGKLIYKHTGRIKPAEVRAVLEKAVGGK